MADSPLHLTLTAEDRPGRFMVANGATSYSIEFRPETDVVLGDLLRRLRPVLVGGSDPSGQLAPLALLREIGTRLWQALLPETMPADLRETLGQNLRAGMTPLLLGLPQNLTTLPWELLCDPERPDDTGFLARRRPMVRLISGGNDLSPLVPPLRMLLLISSPPGLDERERVDVESERAAVEQATRTFREAGLLHLLVEDIVTLRRVQQALVRFKPHILHYIGHGTYEEDLGGFLFWEDEQGHPLPVPDTRIADMLRPRGLRAVLLHGCETAISDEHTDFRGVASALIGAGIPAVLAQQANFTYESSQRASEMFYTTLTSGQSIAEATFEARQALAYADRPDWAVPTLQATAGGLLPLLDPTAPPGLPDPALERGGASADLPAPTGVFVGRQRELRALRMMLESASGPVLALMTGPGGVGKSTLAAQAVTRYGGRFKATLTLRCAGYQGMDLFLQQIGEFLQRQGSPGLLTDILPDPKLSVETKIDAAIEMLDKAGPFLLLVDNLESVQRDDRTLADASLLLFLQRLLTNLRTGRTLITGRYAVQDLLPDGKFAASLLQLDLDDLSVYEIFQLLSRHTALAHLSETERAEVVREFGGLPYVYDLLSSQAASRSLGGLIHDVQGRITRERAQRTAHEWEQIRRQVVEFAALESTVARLPERSQTLLGKLSLFRSSFPLQALEQGLAAVEDEWKPLLDWGLLRFDPVDGDYHLHSLTAHYAQDLLDATDRAATQVQLAEWYLRYGREESHDLADYLEAHRLLRAAGEVERAGELALNLGEVLSRFGLYQLLRELCTATITDMDTTHEGLRAAALHQLGNIAYLQGEYAEARRLYGESLALKERLGDQSGRASTLHQLGNIAHDQGDYAKAHDLYGESLALKERLGDQSGRASTLHQLGNIAYFQGDYAKARRLYGESLASEERLGDQRVRAITLHQLGIIAQDEGDYAEARRLYGESLALKEHLGDQRGQASTLGELGILAQAQGDYAEARRLYGEVLTIFEQLGDLSGRATTLHQLGVIAQDQGDYEEARRLYGESLAIEERLGNQRGRASTLGELGMIAYLQGEYTEARRLYGESLAIEERLGDQRGRATTLHQLGMIAQAQGDYAEARRLYGEVLTIFEQLGDLSGRATTLHQLGILALDQGKYTQARRLYRESLAIGERLGDQSRRASTLGELGMIAYLQKEYTKAHRLYGEVLTIFERLGDQRGRATTLHALGNIAYLQKEYTEARRLYGEVLTIFKRLGDQSGLASTLGQLGLLARQQKDYLAALSYTLQAFDIFERLRSPSRELALRELTQLRRELGETAFAQLWQETMSGQPLPDLPAVDQRQVTLQHVVAFIQAQAWEEKKSILEASPDLLSAEADTLLEELAVAQQEEDIQRLIEQEGVLLHRCRTWGIDPAWYYTLGMRLGDDVALPTEHEAAVMQIASLLAAYQHEEGTALERAIEAMQQLLNRLTAETPPLFEAALLEDLADAMGRLPAGHRVRKLEQMEAYYHEALPAYQAADRPLSVVRIQRSLSSVLSEQGRYDEALELLETAIAGLRAREQDGGEVAWALSDYASTLDNLGRVEDALSAYTEAMTLLPDNAPLYHNRAEIFIHARRLDEAEADLARAVELDGNENSPYLWDRRAQLAIARGDGLRAQQMVDEVVKRDASQDVGLLRVETAWLQGDVQAAQEILQEVWEKASRGKRVSMRRELEGLFDEHSELAGRDVLVGIMGK